MSETSGPNPEAPVRARRRAEAQALREAKKAAAKALKAAETAKNRLKNKNLAKKAPKSDPNALPPQQPKPCLQCGKLIHPNKRTRRTRKDFEERKFCDNACAQAHGRAHPEKFISRELTAYQERLSTDSKVVQEVARRTLSRKSLLYFTKRTHPKYNPGWVHADICMRLERFARQVAEGKSPRLMLLMPPRHGKSELASIRFPAWYLGQYPDHEIINVGYNLDLPMRWSRKVREQLRDPVYHGVFAQTQLDQESSALEAWLTTAGGGFTAAGVGGGITGKGAHVLIVDDPIKNMEEADSMVTREALWDWFWSTAYTRLAPGGGVLLIQTWWNDDDLAGRLQVLSRENPEADQYEVVKYPALAEAFEYRDPETLNITRSGVALHTPEEEAERNKARAAMEDYPYMLSSGLELLRVPGDALHPVRYDEKDLNRKKASMQPRIWSALFQQNPVPDEGMLFRKEYFKYSAHKPNIESLNVFTAWDFAIGQKQQNDWTVGATVVQDTADNLYVVEITRFRGDALQIIEAMVQVAKRWSPANGMYHIGVEDGQIWRSIEPLLKLRMSKDRLYLPYTAMKPLTDKLARARPLQGRMQSGTVLFPKEAPWLGVAETELLRFPAGAHDDIVDALAWVVQLATTRPPPRQWEPPPVRSWKDRLTDMLDAPYTHMGA